MPRHPTISNQIAGCTGSGKSTTATRLSEILGIPFISLDSLFWKPGWALTPSAEFKQIVVDKLTAAHGSWIVDGDYSGRIGTLVTDQTTDVICAYPHSLDALSQG